VIFNASSASKTHRKPGQVALLEGQIVKIAEL